MKICLVNEREMEILDYVSVTELTRNKRKNINK